MYKRHQVRCMLVSSIYRCCILEGISKLLVESNNAAGGILGRPSCGGSSILFPPIQEDVHSDKRAICSLSIKKQEH